MSENGRFKEDPNAPVVSLKGQEDAVNKVIRWVFKNRLAIVSILMLVVILIGVITWSGANNAEKIKNFITLLGGASIIIGIFYSILNYENNQIKIRHVNQLLKELLMFSTAAKAFEYQMTRCFSD